MRVIALASLSYFGIVFAVGFALGITRVLWLTPLLGERTAELMEIPVMTIVSFLAAGFVVKRFAVPGLLAALAVGVIALALLLLLEFSLVLGLRDLTVAEYLATRDPVAGTAYTLSLLLFGLFPLLRKAL